MPDPAFAIPNYVLLRLCFMDVIVTLSLLRRNKKRRIHMGVHNPTFTVFSPI